MDHHSIPEKSLTWFCYITGEDKDRLKPLIFVLIFGVYIYVLNWFVLFVSGEIQFGFYINFMFVFENGLQSFLSFSTF